MDKINTKETIYFKYFFEYILKIYGEDKFKSILKNNDDLTSYLKEYNEVWAQLTAKFLKLNDEKRKIISDVIQVRVYNRIKQDQLNQEMKQDIKDIISRV